MSTSEYLLAGQVSELERLKLQSRVWEPSSRRLLEQIGDGRGARAVDIGCGVMGWLRVLSEWVGPDGQVVGTDIDDAMLAVANEFVAEESLGNVKLVKDDLFATCLEPASFDLVHARYEITPLGRGPEQMTTYLQLVRPGGTVVLEDPDVASWHFNPPAPALEKLITLIVEAFRRTGVIGTPDATTWTFSVASASRQTSEPRSSRSRPGIRTCDCPFSSPLLSRVGCSRWWMPASWSGCAMTRKSS
jgi:ubiquinone/menaquinone biosynthesis C-methylase UbiE